MSDALMKEIIEAAPKLDDKIFHELVDATWKERVRRRDDEDPPDFPAFGELTYGVLTGELQEGKQEFLKRLDSVCKVLGTENLLDALTGSYSQQVTLDTNRVSIIIDDKRVTLDPSMTTDLFDIFIAFGLKDCHLSLGYGRTAKQKSQPSPGSTDRGLVSNAPDRSSQCESAQGIAPRFVTMRDTRGDPSIFGRTSRRNRFARQDGCVPTRL